MNRIGRACFLVGVSCSAACVEDLDREPARERAADAGACDELGYAGTCIGEVSVWFEDASCRVRDCGGEGKTCGYISDDVGWGCVEGTQGSTAFRCGDVGYEGTCLSGDVLVWNEDAACRWADCAAIDRRCGWNDSVGYDCVDGEGEGEGGGGGSVGELVVGGVRLEGNRARWVEYIAKEVIPRMSGSRSDRIDRAAVVAWWSLKEGVLELDYALWYSNCHFPPDEHIGPVDICPNASNPWQVGIAGVQVAWRSLADVEALARSLYPGRTIEDVLAEAAATAGYGPETSVGQTVVSSTDRLRMSWLLRDGAVGFEAQHPDVWQQCFVDAQYWCFGTDWDSSATFAPDRGQSQQVIADLEAIFEELAP